MVEGRGGGDSLAEEVTLPVPSRRDGCGTSGSPPGRGIRSERSCNLLLQLCKQAVGGGGRLGPEIQPLFCSGDETGDADGGEGWGVFLAGGVDAEPAQLASQAANVAHAEVICRTAGASDQGASWDAQLQQRRGSRGSREVSLLPVRSFLSEMASRMWEGLRRFLQASLKQWAGLQSDSEGRVRSSLSLTRGGSEGSSRGGEFRVHKDLRFSFQRAASQSQTASRNNVIGSSVSASR